MWEEKREEILNESTLSAYMSIDGPEIYSDKLHYTMKAKSEKSTNDLM